MFMCGLTTWSGITRPETPAPGVAAASRLPNPAGPAVVLERYPKGLNRSGSIPSEKVSLLFKKLEQNPFSWGAERDSN